MRSLLLISGVLTAAFVAACGSASSGSSASGAAGVTGAGAAGPVGAGGSDATGPTGAGAGAGATSTTGAGGAASVGGASASAGATGAAGTPGDGPTFIAFAASFDGFEKWQAYPLGNVAPTTNEMDGPRTIFINKLPPKGSTEFPVGTIIVKAIEIDGPTTWQTFAMVKRGGGFNALGANGWEWFELSVADDYTTDVLWRGVAPPSDAGYGGGTKGGICNTCHMDFDGNDYVQDAFLQLPSL